ncbi:MAG TPA: metallophosphoesterase, partial [Pseudoduganella sp.]
VGWLLIRYTASQKWQAIYAKPQFNEGVLPHAPSPVANVSILHASDLHISEDDDIPITEGGLAFLKPEIQAMLNAITRDAHSCDAVLLTGDITDTGAANAWLRFLDNCPPDLQSKVLLVPGNHDLNFQDSLLAAQAERAGGAGRRRRQIRMIAAMCELMQERPLLLDRATDRIIPLKRYVERQFRKYPSASSAAAMPPKMIENLWRSLFPMVVPVGSERDGKRLGVILLDSVKPNSIGLTNAIGTLTPGTNEACRTLINRLADTCDSFVFALHHHVAMPLGGRARDRVQNPGLVLENAGVLIETLRMRGEPTIVFHGHRHKTYTGTATDSDVAIIASPSASIGKGNAIGHGSWRIADLFCSPDGCWLTDVPRRISMAGVPDDPFPPRVDPLSETLVNTPFSPHEPRS